MTVTLTGLTERQRQSWLGLLDVAADFPNGWCLVGGQMVHLYCQERGSSPSRPTNDGDVVLDVRAQPNVLRDFTGALAALGFTSAGVSPEGHQHRWVRDRASIDLLIPQGLGRAAGSRTGITGGVPSHHWCHGLRTYLRRLPRRPARHDRQQNLRRTDPTGGVPSERPRTPTGRHHDVIVTKSTPTFLAVLAEPSTEASQSVLARILGRPKTRRATVPSRDAPASPTAG